MARTFKFAKYIGNWKVYSHQTFWREKSNLSMKVLAIEKVLLAQKLKICTPRTRLFYSKILPVNTLPLNIEFERSHRSWLACYHHNLHFCHHALPSALPPQVFPPLVRYRANSRLRSQVIITPGALRRRRDLRTWWKGPHWGPRALISFPIDR